MPGEEELTSTKVKIIIIGDTGVGKSCLATALVKGAAFTAEQLAQSRPTSLLDTHIFHPNPLMRTISYQLFDFSGADLYKGTGSHHCQDATIVLLAFDLTQVDSFGRLQYWLERIPHYIKHPNYHIILVGTKSDLVDQRQVSQEAIGHFCSQLQTQRQQEIPYIAVSVGRPEELQASLFAAIQQFHPLPETASVSPSSSPSPSPVPTLSFLSSIGDAPGSPLLRRRGSTGDLVGSYTPPTLFGPTSVLKYFDPKLSFSSSSSSSSSNIGPMTGSRVDLDAQPIFSPSSSSSGFHQNGNTLTRGDEQCDKNDEATQHVSPRSPSPPFSSSSSSSSSSSLHQSTGDFTLGSGQREDDDEEEAVQSRLSSTIADDSLKFTRSFRKIYTQLYDQSFFKNWRTLTVQEVIEGRHQLLSRETMEKRAEAKPASRTAKTMIILQQLEEIKSKQQGDDMKHKIYQDFFGEFKFAYEGLYRGLFFVNPASKMKKLVETLKVEDALDFKALTVDILCHAQFDPSSRTAQAVKDAIPSLRLTVLHRPNSSLAN